MTPSTSSWFYVVNSVLFVLLSYEFPLLKHGKKFLFPFIFVVVKRRKKPVYYIASFFIPFQKSFQPGRTVNTRTCTQTTGKFTPDCVTRKRCATQTLCSDFLPPLCISPTRKFKVRILHSVEFSRSHLPSESSIKNSSSASMTSRIFLSTPDF